MFKKCKVYLFFLFISFLEGKKAAKKKGSSFQTVSALFRVWYNALVGFLCEEGKKIYYVVIMSQLIWVFKKDIELD